MWLPSYPWWRTDPNKNSTSSTSLQKAKNGRFVRVIMFDTTWILREIKGISLPKNYLFWGGAKLVLTFSIIWSVVCLENITGDLEDVFFWGNEGWNVWEKWFDDREHSCLIYSSVSKLKHDIASKKPYAESERHSYRSKNWCHKIANHMSDLCMNAWIFLSHNSIHVRLCGNWT